MNIIQTLPMERADGSPSGRYRTVQLSDEHDGADPLCDCGGRSHDSPETAGHESEAAARACPVVQARLTAMGFAAPSPTLEDLARVAFEAYGASTGGKTWDGKPIPPFDEIRNRTPHVAAAWEAAVGAVLAKLGRSAPR